MNREGVSGIKMVAAAFYNWIDRSLSLLELLHYRLIVTGPHRRISDRSHNPQIDSRSVHFLAFQMRFWWQYALAFCQYVMG